MWRRACILMITLNTTILCAEGKNDKLSVTGYLKYLHRIEVIHQPDTLLTGELLHQRTNVRWDVNHRFSIRIDLRTRLFYGPLYTGQSDFINSLRVREALLNTDYFPIKDRHAVLLLQADRSYVEYHTERWNVRAGKQRVNWGTNLIWNPNDVFNSYNILDFDYEERPGTDAIRIQHTFTTAATLDGVWSPKRSGGSKFATMYRTHAGTYDLQFLAGRNQAQWMTGMGWAGNLKDAGFKGEMNWYPGNNQSLHQFLAAGTLDYTFEKGWYTYISYLYQQHTPPSGQLGSYDFTYPVSSPKYLMPFVNSFFGGVMKELSPIISLQLALIYGDRNSTTLFYPSLTWNAGENMNVLLTGIASLSKQQEKLENISNSIFLRMKYSF